jgi:hypothetical protein
MSRGYGKVQSGCLLTIWWAERKGKPAPTTYDIAADVYHVERDDDGCRYVSDAQHVAVKRALEGLRRQGKVIGVDKRYCHDDHEYDGRSERALCWMSEQGARAWIHRQRKQRDGMVESFKAEMREIGMKVTAGGRV